MKEKTQLTGKTNKCVICKMPLQTEAANRKTPNSKMS